MLDPPILDRIAAAKEVRIETHEAGRAHRTIIWVAVDDGAIYVRSVRGHQGHWYRRAATNPDVALLVGDLRVPLRAVAVTDAASVRRASNAFARKYPKGQSLASMLRPEVLDTTLRLAPPE